MSIKVLINPGHGYPDPGACNEDFYGEMIKEADIALIVGGKAADYLKEAGGYDVYVHQDNNLCGEAGPYEYSVIGQANANRMDYIISIHTNSGGGRGTETLIWEYDTEAEEMAQCIQDKIVDMLDTTDRGVKDRHALGKNLAILGKTYAPACLVELAFIDTEDVELLVDAEKQDLFAKAIATGFTDFIAIKNREE